MKPCRVALAQIAPRLGQLDANVALHLEAIQRARREGAGLVAFPELSLTGYLLRDDVPEVAVTLDDPRLSRLLRASREIDVLVGLVEEAPGHRFHNTAAYLSGGRVLHVHRKVYLPTYGMFDEGRDFAAGDRFRAFVSRRGCSPRRGPRSCACCRAAPRGAPVPSRRTCPASRSGTSSSRPPPSS